MDPQRVWTIEQLFAGRPAARALFDAVKRSIESLGPVTVAVTKTQVSFGVKMKFAWVWLPQMWTKNRPEESITLTFDADHEIVHPRIAAAVEPRPGRWTHHVVIEREADLDDDVLAWLRDAYAMGSSDKRRSARR